MGAMGGGAGGGGAGGGGAGGGGAGGGGAGGGGAGGGGAGGGGAGGGGAGSHAGGPSTTQLNAALAVTHDAISGYWDGMVPADLKLPHFPSAAAPLKSLQSGRRVDMLTAELLARFQINGATPTAPDPIEFTPGHFTLAADSQEIFATSGPTLGAIKKQLIWLRNYADLRFDRVAEINLQLGDVLSFFGAVTRLDASAREHTLELLDAVFRVTYALEMRAKWYTWTPRPIDLTQQVQPVIQTPDHSSFPSGHATEAFAVATILERLGTGKPAKEQIALQSMPYRLAHRIAVNRTIAGVHYPIDSAAGAVMGTMIGEAIWSMLVQTPQGATSSKATYKPPTEEDAAGVDFILSEMDTTGWTANAAHGVTAGPITDAYWNALNDEWQLT